jgi:hypothetical protein
MSVPKRSVAQDWVRSQDLRRWGLPAFCGVLAAIGTAESMRLLVAGQSTFESRWGGWYLLVVSAFVAAGALAKPESNVPLTPSTLRSDGQAPAPEDPPPPSRTGSRTRDAILLFALTLLFAWALPWVGFALANAVFICAYLVWIDRRSWRVAIAIAVLTDVVLVGGLHLLDVLLPTGVIGFGL